MEDMTFMEAANVWGEMYGSVKRKTYSTDDIRRLNKHILPGIGNMKISEIRRRDLARLHLKISRKAPIEANRCLGLIQAIYNKLIEWEYHEGGNPADTIKKNHERAREEVVAPEDLERLLIAISQASHSEAFLLILFCGLRISEALGAQWQNLRGSELLVEKTKNTKSHIVFLPAWLASSLEDRRHDAVSEYIFTSRKPGQKGKRIYDLRKPWDKIRRESGLLHVKLHVLRATFATIAAESGATEEEVSKALNHSSVAITKKHYIHLKVSKSKKAFEAAHRGIESHLTRIEGKWSQVSSA